MTEPTPLDIESLRRLLSVISPLPWWVEPEQTRQDAYIACGDGYDVIERYDVDTDYAYIVAAVNAVPQLLDRLEAAEARYHAAGEMNIRLRNEMQTILAHRKASAAKLQAAEARAAAAEAQVKVLTESLSDFADPQSWWLVETQNIHGMPVTVFAWKFGNYPWQAAQDALDGGSVDDD